MEFQVIYFIPREDSKRLIIKASDMVGAIKIAADYATINNIKACEIKLSALKSTFYKVTVRDIVSSGDRQARIDEVKELTKPRNRTACSAGHYRDVIKYFETLEEAEQYRDAAYGIKRK